MFEALLRVFVPGLGYFYKANTFFREKMIDNGMYWQLKNREPIGEKVKKRLLILGDSVAYGWGVDRKDVFTTILSDKTDYEVINFGVPGTNSVEQSLLFDIEGKALKPDIVFWIITNNDVAARSKKPTSFQRNVYRSYLLTALFYVKKRMKQPVYTQLQFDEARQAVMQMKQLCNNLVVCLYASPETIKRDKIIKFYQKELVKNRINFFLLTDKIFENKIDRIDGHLNAKGHKLLAASINQVLKLCDTKN